LAERVVAQADVPEVRTSIKDGYAVVASDPKGLRKVIGSSTAGSPYLKSVSAGECVRVSTGAAVPDGADAVVMVEHTLFKPFYCSYHFCCPVLLFLRAHRFSMPGSDIAKGDLLLDSGCTLGSAEIGVLAGSGKRSVLMYRRPKVCILSTGNEVSCTAEDVPTGHIRDTNRPQLIALFSSLGFKAIDAGIAVDRLECLRECLVEAIKVSFRYAHVLVTSGGVSMGEKDLMKDVLMNDFGFKIHFGRVWMKPGLPTTFATGMVDGERKFVFALPGNPVSSWVTAQLFAVPLLRKIAGHSRIFQNVLKVRISQNLNLDARPEYARAWLQYGGDIPLAITTGDQISSRYIFRSNSLSGATVLLKLPGKSPQCSVLQAGEIVDALWLGPN
uniref:MoCF_biosynth domain-containing protein n=1 Tax=Haemonchus placei TaxID=6290 RepID=A0A0N4X2V7_HAEPC